MKPIFLHIWIKLQDKCVPRPEFSQAGRIFTLPAPVYTMLSEVWRDANRAMVTNNLIVLTEVCANQNHVNRGFPV